MHVKFSLSYPHTPSAADAVSLVTVSAEQWLNFSPKVSFGKSREPLSALRSKVMLKLIMRSKVRNTTGEKEDFKSGDKHKLRGSCMNCVAAAVCKKITKFVHEVL